MNFFLHCSPDREPFGKNCQGVRLKDKDKVHKFSAELSGIWTSSNFWIVDLEMMHNFLVLR